MDTLFDDIERTDGSRSGELESSFAFLNRVNSPIFQNVRDSLEEWFAYWPESHRQDVRGRFRSQDAQGFLGAFWELYIYEVFRRQGFRISIHPSIPGSSYHPDFFLERRGCEFFLEAKAVVTSQEEAAYQKHEAAILTTLNRLRSPDYWLEPEVRARGSKAPAIARHIRRIEEWLAKLDAIDVRKPMDRWNSSGLSGEEDSIAYEIVEAGWRIRLKPIAKSGESKGLDGDRPVGVILPYDNNLAIDDVSPIRKGLKRKTKYGAVEKPLLLALLVDRPFVDRDDVESALFGSLAVQYTQRLRPDDVSWSRWVRPADGFFRTSTGTTSGKKIAAVIVAFNLRPWTVASSEFRGLTLWRNPWASNPIDLDLPFSTAELQSNPPRHEVQHTTARVASRDLVGLPHGWPGFPTT